MVQDVDRRVVDVAIDVDEADRPGVRYEETGERLIEPALVNLNVVGHAGELAVLAVPTFLFVCTRPVAGKSFERVEAVDRARFGVLRDDAG